MSILTEATEQQQATPVATEAPKDMDELLNTLAEETKEYSENAPEPTYDYPDFDHEPEPVSEPDPDPLSGIKGLEHIDTDNAESMLTDLAALPAETIVDTVDLLATELAISRFGIKDYNGDDYQDVYTSAKDKKALVRATERYLASQHIKVTPLTALIVTVILVYGKKIMYCAKIRKVMQRNKELEQENREFQNKVAEYQNMMTEKEAHILDLQAKLKHAQGVLQEKATDEATMVAKVPRKATIKKPVKDVKKNAS